MDAKRLFSNRKSVPLLLGTVAFTVVTLLMLHKGNQTLDQMAPNSAGTAAPNQRELVEIRIGSRWKLGRTSWGSNTPAVREPVPVDEEPDPLAKTLDGLDIAVAGH